MLCRKKLRDSHKKTILIFYIPKFQYSVNLLINILFTNHILVSTCCCNKLPQKWWLKQHEFMIFTFWRWENKNKPPWAKIKMSARPPSFEEAPGGECVFLPLPASRGGCPYSCWPPSLFKSSSVRLSPSGAAIFLVLFLLPWRTLVITLDPPGWSRMLASPQRKLMSKQFHRNLNSPLSGNLTYGIVWGLGRGIFEGSLFCSHRVYRVILAFLFAFFCVVCISR